jgi:xanthine/CO dehydrogenase XdhC/CoxF family maturation factor
VTYDARARDDDDLAWGFGLGCDGVVDVLLERVGAPGPGLDALDFIAECHRDQKRGALATVFGGSGAPLGARVAVRSDGKTQATDDLDPATRELLVGECLLMTGSGGSHAGGSHVQSFRSAAGVVDVLVEAIRPPPRLFLFGSGRDAVPVVAIANRVGWETMVCRAQSHFETRDRLVEATAVLSGRAADFAAHVDASDRALAVVMAHDYERDRESLGMLLGTSAEYIGVLGPRRRAERMFAELGVLEWDPRIHAPVGLDLGAETPQEIALAIIAEGQAVLTRMPATSLRERRGPIHAPSASAAEE